MDPLHRFRTRQYDRANQAWECGSEGCGLPCPLGPTMRGDCRAECTPIKDGDRYYCENSSELSGDCDEGPHEDGTCWHFPAQCKPRKQGKGWSCTRGLCPNGPLPNGECSRTFATCVPTRSLMAKRYIVVVTVLAGVVGMLFLLSTIPQRHAFVSAGDLTRQHSSLTTCSDCHFAAEGQVHDWIGLAVGDKQLQARQSTGCLECHQDILGTNAMQAHGLDAAALQQMSDSAKPVSSGGMMVSLVNLARSKPPAPVDEHDCAKCHSEHRGADFDLTHMSTTQCQACHASIFHSFEFGHPDFSLFPYTRRTRLYFDHLSHFGLHFKDGRFGDRDGPTQCSACHQSDDQGSAMLIKDYQDTCASCHASQILDDSIPGIAFFSVPIIDMESMSNGNLDIGQWPSTHPAHVGADGYLSPFTQILLGGNPDFAAAAERLDELDLAELDELALERLLEVEEFAWSFKKALHELISQGRREFESRLSSALGQQLQPAIADNYYGRIVTAQQRWFPDLESEIRLRGTPPEAAATESAGDAADVESSDVESAGDAAADDDATQSVSVPTQLRDEQVDAGWYLQNLDLTVRYRPAGHADAWMKLWLESAANGLKRSAQSFKHASQLSDVFDLMSQPTAPGRCMKCHTAEDQLAGHVELQWESRPHPAMSSPITRFDHQPHLINTKDESCSDCHVLNTTMHVLDNNLFRSEYFHSSWAIQTDATTFTSDFRGMTKSACASCHVDANAGQDCLTCHNYHVHQ